MTGSSGDLWSSEQKIYDYIVSNIKYASDVDIPYPSTYWTVRIDGLRYVTEFTIDKTRNYVQTPRLTLEVKQGDCEDQAVLAYAMIKHYMKYILGTEYTLYIANMEFSDGSGHLAVVMPVQGGQICIIDPAGKYLTSRRGIITSKQALFELQAYSSYWSEYGSITYMELYDVNVEDGSYDFVVKGNINEVATYCERR